jgi:hypothetical protein
VGGVLLPNKGKELFLQDPFIKLNPSYSQLMSLMNTYVQASITKMAIDRVRKIAQDTVSHILSLRKSTKLLQRRRCNDMPSSSAGITNQLGIGIQASKQASSPQLIMCMFY